MISCTLCCKETFKSKHELIEHLANVLANLICPICKDKWSTVVHLIEHLSLDNCQLADSVQLSHCNNEIEIVTNHNGKDKNNINLEIVQVSGKRSCRHCVIYRLLMYLLHCINIYFL